MLNHIVGTGRPQARRRILDINIVRGDMQDATKQPWG